MNILWMTLCTCMVILVSMDWGLQSMSRDHQNLIVARRYFLARTNTQLACQKQYYAQLKREWSGLEKSTRVREEAIGDPIHEQENTPEHELSQDIKLYRFGAYPLNARFPLTIKNLKGNHTKSTYWQEGFWKLLDKLYESEEFYRSWRRSLDTAAFMEELVEGLENVMESWAGAGTWGLLRISFKNSEDQRVWSQMIKGSDLIGSRFPSLLTYVWAGDLGAGKGTFSTRLNLPTASLEIIEALFGLEFATAWQEKVDAEKERRMEEGGYSASLSDPLLFEGKRYSQIFNECKSLSTIPEDQIISFADMSVGNWQIMDEYLLKGLYLGSGYLATTMQIRRQKK